MVFATNLMPKPVGSRGSGACPDSTYCELKIDMDLEDYEPFHWELKAIIWVKKMI